MNESSKKRSRQEFDPTGSGSHVIISASGNTARKHARTPSASSSNSGEWDDAMHRDLVSAIFEMGMRNASPAVILENMIDRPGVITSERVKSKLQKYRNNKEKSIQDFMEEYDAFLAKLQALGSAGASNAPGFPSTQEILQMMGCRTIVGGDAAALVSYITKNEDTTNKTATAALSSLKSDSTLPLGRPVRKDALDFIEDFAGAGVPFPDLTEEERRSSLGISILQVKQLFQSMRHHLMTSRESAKKG